MKFDYNSCNGSFSQGSANHGNNNARQQPSQSVHENMMQRAVANSILETNRILMFNNNGGKR